ncbi:MAG: helix-turn-helix domain-containing protein [Defluviitaleaceae bacterium]|nr:helix-turn-helix domain-containing protein [Defluviitaleaceae bacterium]
MNLIELEGMSNSQLVDYFLTIKGGHEVEKVDNLIDEIEVRKNHDQQLADALTVLELWKGNRYTGYLGDRRYTFKELCRKVAPIHGRLSKKSDWELYDFALLCRTIQFIQDYEKVDTIAKEVLEKLEKYSDHKKYIGMKLAIHINCSRRFMRARYFDFKELQRVSSFMDKPTPEDLEEIGKEIEELFLKYINIAIDICEHNNFPFFKAGLTIRKGSFLRDENLVSEGFAVLENAGKHELIKAMQNEIDECGLYFYGSSTTKAQFDAIVGANIKLLREAHRMTSDEVGRIIGVDNDVMDMIELGARSLTFYEISKLSDLFKVSFTKFLEPAEYGDLTRYERHRSDNFCERAIKIQRLSTFAEKLQVGELNYAIKFMNGLLEFKEAIE